jgi:hypothetical protein
VLLLELGGSLKGELESSLMNKDSRFGSKGERERGGGGQDWILGKAFLFLSDHLTGGGGWRPIYSPHQIRAVGGKIC